MSELEKMKAAAAKKQRQAAGKENDSEQLQNDQNAQNDPEQSPSTEGPTQPLASDDVTQEVTQEKQKRLDESSVPGGKYLVDGRWVDANGKPLK